MCRDHCCCGVCDVDHRLLWWFAIHFCLISAFDCNDRKCVVSGWFARCMLLRLEHCLCCPHRYLICYISLFSHMLLSAVICCCVVIVSSPFRYRPSSALAGITVAVCLYVYMSVSIGLCVISSHFEEVCFGKGHSSVFVCDLFAFRRGLFW